MSEYLPHYENFEPRWDNELTVQIDRPPVRKITDSPWIEYEAGPRIRLVIEGAAELVAPFIEAIEPLTVKYAKQPRPQS